MLASSLSHSRLGYVYLWMRLCVREREDVCVAIFVCVGIHFVFCSALYDAR